MSAIQRFKHQLKGIMEHLRSTVLRGLGIFPGDEDAISALERHLPNINSSITSSDYSERGTGRDAVEICAAVISRKIRSMPSIDRDRVLSQYRKLCRSFLRSENKDWPALAAEWRNKIAHKKRLGLDEFESVVWFCIPFLDAMVREGLIDRADALAAVRLVDEALLGYDSDKNAMKTARAAEGGRFASWIRGAEELRSRKFSLKQAIISLTVFLASIAAGLFMLALMVVALTLVGWLLITVGNYLWDVSRTPYYNPDGSRNRELIWWALLFIGGPAGLLMLYLDLRDRRWGVAIWNERR